MTFASDRADIQAWTDETNAQAGAFLQNLLDITNVAFSDGFNIDRLLPNAYGYESVPQISFPIITATRPDIDTATDAPPDAPETEFSTITDVTVPEFDTAAPVLAFPTAPSSALPDAPGAAPSFATPDIPTAPSTALPAVPTFDALLLPDAPSVDLPSLVSSLPDDDMLTPTAEFTFAEAVYESTLLDPLKAKLLDDLTNGGYGIEDDDEEALFNRARDREVEAMLSRVEDAGRAMAVRGFPLPPGELSIHVDRAYQDMQDKVSSASRDITLERSKLYVDNRRFTIEQVKGVEQVLIGFHNSVQERSLNIARTTVELSIAIYNTLVERFKARLESYKSEASVFAERIRGELAKAEIYRTQIEAKTVEVTMQRQLVEIYRAQIAGVEASVNIYRTQMDAASIRAGIERTKLEAYRASIDAYTAQVQAKVAEFSAYRAQIDGETAKVTAFDAQVRAFGGQVSAAKVRSDVQLGRLQAESEQARVKLANFQAEVEGYKANVARLVDAGRLEVDLYRTDVDGSRMLNDASVAKASLQQKALDSTVAHNIQISNVAIENAKAKLEATVAALKFRTATTQFASEKFYALLTAIATAVNSLSVETVSE